MRTCLLLGAIPVALAASVRPVPAQERALPEVYAARIPDSASSPIRLDGVLTEAVWQAAPVASGFRQREPLEGDLATEETEVRILYDGATLYIGIVARDRDPGSIISRILQRDRIMETNFSGEPEFAGDDAVAILFDPFHDHRNAMVFATNPNGAEFDATITDEGREINIDWRGVWAVKAQVTDQGWSAEFAIPFRTLRFPGGDSVEPWGFNVYRVIRRENEEVLWSAWSRDNEGFTRVSRAGHLHGLTGLPRPSANLDIKPYFLGGAISERIADTVRESEPKLKVGGDLKYEVTPGLVLDVTVNTDFAQVEVDNEQVNLTRFSLFFPEKRDFFLENSGIFEFGNRGMFETPPFLLFFSRRIGISDDGEVPILGGLRFTGRAGNQTIGLMDVVTNDAFGIPTTNWAVVRLKRDVGGANYIGAMITDRRSKDDWNLAAGADFSWWATSTLNLQGFAARTSTSGRGGEDWAYRLAADYDTGVFGLNTAAMFVGPEATADMGFITRKDIRRFDVFARLTPRPQVLGLRKIDLFIQGQYFTRTDWVTQDWLAAVAIAPDWNSGDEITFIGGPAFTRLDEGFDLTDDVSIPPGDYDAGQIGWFASTSGNRALILASNGTYSQYFGGTLFSANGSLTATLNRHVSLTGGYTYNDVDTPYGAFRADIGSLRLSYAFSTNLFANALIQYNSLDNKVSANVRINFIHSPGSDLFIVFNELRGNDRSLWAFEARGAVVKITYLARI
ncbi:MAG: DUF5916 domain-containing protein [Gemmatimonadales bacterium]